MKSKVISYKIYITKSLRTLGVKTLVESRTTIVSNTWRELWR